MLEKVYGIDLGTTNSAIAIFERGEAKILKNMDDDEVTPSVVVFTGVSSDGKDEFLVGEQAKNMAAACPEQVVQFVKRNMGNHGEIYNFTAPSGKDYTPEMISSLILRKICKDAEQYDGENLVKDVVITVPAYFDDAKRIATKQAGEIAGLHVLRVINEPTAAAIAFGLDHSYQGRILVYDLGGGTFDVTVMDVKDGFFDVIATGGDPQLGGINFDQKLVELIREQLEEKGCTVDDEDDAIMADIREKAEKTKIQLSGVEHSRPFFTIQGKTYRLDISRESFEAASKPLIERTQFILDDVMCEKGVIWEEIDQVLMVGGSTKMPMVKRWLEQISGKEVAYKVDPDTAVAKGAAIFASTLKEESGSKSSVIPMGLKSGEDKEEGIAKLVISDVTSQSLGAVSWDTVLKKEVNTVIIPNNTKIPAKCSQEFMTLEDNQTSLKLQVTEGNDSELEYVKIIGECFLRIPPYPAGSGVKVIYAYDPDQTVFIEVIDMVTNKSLGTFEVERTSNLSNEEMVHATDIVCKTNVE